MRFVGDCRFMLAVWENPEYSPGFSINYFNETTSISRCIWICNLFRPCRYRSIKNERVDIIENRNVCAVRLRITSHMNESSRVFEAYYELISKGVLLKLSFLSRSINRIFKMRKIIYVCL